MTANVSPATAVGVLGILVAGVLGAFAVLVRGGEMDETDWRLIGTLAVVLFCGAAVLTAHRFALPYRALGLVPAAALVFLISALWSERLWDGRTESMAKAVVSALAATLAVLLVASLRLLTPFTNARVWVAFLSVAGLIAATTLVGVVLLWSWDATFFDEGESGDTGGVTIAALRALLGLIALSIAAFLALPFAVRLLTRRDDAH